MHSTALGGMESGRTFPDIEVYPQRHDFILEGAPKTNWIVADRSIRLVYTELSHALSYARWTALPGQAVVVCFSRAALVANREDKASPK